MRFKWLLSLAIALFLSGQIHAQNQANGTIVATNSACRQPGGANAVTCVLLNVGQNVGGVTFQINQTYSATLQFEATVDNNVWVSLSVTPSSSTTTVTSTTGTGLWQANVAGYTAVRVRASAYTSGGAVVTIRASLASARSNGGGSGGGGCTPAGSAGQLLADSGSGTCNDSLATDNGTTLTYTGTGGITASDGPVTAASDGTHAGIAALVGNTANPSIPANEFGFLGFAATNTAALFLQPCATAPVANDVVTIGAPSGNVASVCWHTNSRVCPFALGDSVNAIAMATYPASGAILNCVNNSGVTWTVTGIHCFTDNAGTSTLDVQNNAGTSLLTGVITCNATKTSGGAAGTQSATTTIATTNGINFVFAADGTSKYVTGTVDFTY